MVECAVIACVMVECAVIACVVVECAVIACVVVEGAVIACVVVCTFSTTIFNLPERKCHKKMVMFQVLRSTFCI